MGKKIFFIVAIVLVIGALGASYWYFKMQQNDVVSAVDAVPVSSAAIIEVKSPRTFLKNIQGNKVFADIKELTFAEDFAKNLAALDTLLTTNSELAESFKDKPFLVSFHNTTRLDYEPLAVMTFNSNAQGRRALEQVVGILEKSGAITNEKYEQAKIYKYTNRQNAKTVCYLTFVHGYLLATTNEMLMQESIRQTTNTFGISQNPSFLKVKQWAGKNVDANIYLQFKFLNPFIQKQFVNNLFSDMAIQTFSDWGGFDLSMKGSNWLVNGYTLQSSVKNQWSQLFEGQESVQSNLTKNVPMGVNGFSWFGLSNFGRYQRALESYMESVGQLNRFQTNQNVVKQTFGNTVINTIADNFNHGLMQIAMPDGTSIFVIEAKGRYEAGQLLDYFVRGKTESPSVKEFRIDNDARFNIYEMPLEQVPARIFGPWFGQCKAQYVCAYDNMLVFGDTYNVVSRFVYDNVLHKNLHFDPDFNQFDNYITNKTNFYTYLSFTGSENLLSRILSSGNVIGYHNNQEAVYNFYGLIWQFSVEDGFLYHNTFLRHQPTHSNTASTLWESHLDTLAAFKPVFVDNHNTGEKEIFIQDLRNNIYLINAAGRTMWKKHIDEPIIGTVQQVDYYRNGKLQIFFNTATKMYLIDRNGNHVDRYPITLPSPTNLPVAVFDYSKNRNYRLFVECANADIHVYSIDGKTLPDFSLQCANQVPITAAQHFINNDKDYISITDTSRIYLIDRRGNMRVDFKERIRPSVNNELKYMRPMGDSAAALVRTSTDGTLCFLHFDGSVSKRKIGDFSPAHFFDIEDITGDSKPELIYVDENVLSVYNFNGKKLFEHKFGEPITQRPAYYKLSSTQTAIGITETESAHIYLIDSKGQVLPGFPLRGKTRFSIGVMKTGQAYYNLIVGGNDQYLFNYKLNR
ncbi:MAG: hypothetical protein IKZ99_09845 [Salinivirgaceae bacterium]|nr:hypothetical protein [Salinivirgaceae bacterium]